MVLAAHGSRDRRFAATARRVRDAVAARLPMTEVVLGYLDLDVPTIGDALSGADDCVVVPLLLSDAFHNRVDLPARIRQAAAGADGRIRQTAPLADDRLTDALSERVLECGLRRPGGMQPRDGVLLVAVGSRDPSADRLMHRRGTDLVRRLPRVPVATAFATRIETVDAAVAALTRGGAARIVVSPCFLSAGTLTDRLERRLDGLAVDWTAAAPLAAHRLLIDIVCDRYRLAAADPAVSRSAMI